MITAFWATRLLAGLLSGVETIDLPTITGVALLLTLVAAGLLASRAARQYARSDDRIARRIDS